MRLLLTSAGIRNASIHDALLDLLGKPIDEAIALYIPTATHVLGKPQPAYSFISGYGSSTPMCELGWKSVGVLELSALPSIGRERWEPVVRETDVLLVNGGNQTLGLVDLAIFPHLDHPELPHNTVANAETWAAGMPGPAYGIDEETAIKVVDGSVDVVSKGEWRLFNA